MGGDAPGRGLQDRPTAPGLRGAHPAGLRRGPARLTAPDDLPVWIDGRLGGAPALDAGPPGEAVCFTTARVAGGAVVWPGRHARRLVRDARALGVAPPDAELCARALEELARAAFPGADGVVRLELARDAAGRSHLVGRARPLPPQRPRWQAIAAPGPHAGPGAALGVKCAARAELDAALAAARAAGADEALLFDRAERLVEGAHTNLVVVCADGRALTPPLARGGVAGLAREIALAVPGGPAEGDVGRAALAAARELVALNAVCGARPVVRVDGTPLGDGAPGPVAARLAAVLAEAGDA